MKSKSSRSADQPWADTDATSAMWSHIQQGDIDSLEDWMNVNPNVVDLRSNDGRGALWWAYEKGDQAIIDLLLEHGADPEAKDSQGLRPTDMRKKRKKRKY